MATTKFKYAVKRGGKNYGINNLEQLKDMARRKKIEPQDHIYCYQSEKWIRAGQINSLGVIFAFLSNGNNINRIPLEDTLSAPLLSISQVERHITPPSPEHQSILTISRPERKPSILKRKNTLDLNKLFDEFDLNTEPQIQAKPKRAIEEEIASPTVSNADEVIKSLNDEVPVKTSYFSKKIFKERRSKSRITTRTITLMAILVMITVGALTFLAGSWLEKENHQITVSRLGTLEVSPSLPIINVDE